MSRIALAACSLLLLSGCSLVRSEIDYAAERVTHHARRQLDDMLDVRFAALSDTLDGLTGPPQGESLWGDAFYVVGSLLILADRRWFHRRRTQNGGS